jgi:hypothetical protein
MSFRERERERREKRKVVPSTIKENEPVLIGKACKWRMQ